MIRVHFGPFAGELQDVRADLANELVAQGRATDPRMEEVSAVTLSVPEVKLEPVPKRRGKS